MPPRMSATPRVITFVANDGAATSNTATSTVTIVAVDSPPTADNDAYSVAEGGTLTVPAPGVLDGDVDPEGDTPITAVLVTGPANASSFTLNADGSFTYTHNGSETTTDAFTYQASRERPPVERRHGDDHHHHRQRPADGGGRCQHDDRGRAGQRGRARRAGQRHRSGSRRHQDGRAGERRPGQRRRRDRDGQGRTVTLNANGSYTYNPGTAFQSLGAGQTGTDTFTYTMQDAAAAPSNVATVTITMTGAQRRARSSPPAAGAAAFTEDGPAVAVAPALDRHRRGQPPTSRPRPCRSPRTTRTGRTCWRSPPGPGSPACSPRPPGR